MISVQNYKKVTFRTRLLHTLDPTALFSVHFNQSVFAFIGISLGSIFLPGGQFIRNYSETVQVGIFFFPHVDLLVKSC